MGIDAPDNHKMLADLYLLRQECHRLLGDGKHNYEAPSLEDFITNPRMRSPTALTYLKWEDLAEDEAEGDGHDGTDAPTDPRSTWTSGPRRRQGRQIQLG